MGHGLKGTQFSCLTKNNNNNKNSWPKICSFGKEKIREKIWKRIWKKGTRLPNMITSEVWTIERFPRPLISLQWSVYVPIYFIITRICNSPKLVNGNSRTTHTHKKKKPSRTDNSTKNCNHIPNNNNNSSTKNNYTNNHHHCLTPMKLQNNPNQINKVFKWIHIYAATTLKYI